MAAMESEIYFRVRF